MSGNINLSIALPSLGRPVDRRSEASRQPWLKAGLSKRTYYRRKASGTLPEELSAPHLHDAHVTAWLASLDPIERLDRRARARRCVIEAFRA